jgi:hypothetical protein
MKHDKYKQGMADYLQEEINYQLYLVNPFYKPKFKDLCKILARRITDLFKRN